jgi:hypothetical protein
MDLRRIDLIKQSDPIQLRDNVYVENLMSRLGFNTEILHEQPEVVKKNGGGLRIWQYPNQFSKYLCLLQQYPISSYIEIGCRWGGTFVLTTEYLKRFNQITESVAVDIIDSPVQEYCAQQPETRFLKMNSQSEEFKNYIQQKKFDIIFIDGDHSYQGVAHDYEQSKNSGTIYVFHDIVNAACPGVVQFWNELKEKENETFNFFEFTEQYDDVWQTTGQKFLGIGVAIKK